MRKNANIPNIQKAFRNQWGNYFLKSVENRPKIKHRGRNAIISIMFSFVNIERNVNWND